MNNLNFKNWILKEDFKDIFGFEKPKKLKYDSFDERYVTKPDLIIKSLLRRKLDGKYSVSNFSNEILWQNDSNDKIKLSITPYGSLRVVLKRINTNKIGEEVWITKYVNLLLDDDKEINEEDVAEKLFSIIEKINKENVDSSIKEINFEKIAIKIGEYLKAKRPCKWMIFDKIKKIKDGYYVICFNMTGSGLESPSGSGPSNKIEQYQVNLIYNKESGVIRCFGTSIESSKKVAQWSSGIPDWDENFLTSQNINEIISCIYNSLKSF